MSIKAFALNQSDLDMMAKKLVVNYTLLNASATCPATVEQCYLSELSFTLPYTLSSGDWAIYFSQLMPIVHSSNQAFTISHINGDLHKISPTDSFNGFIENKAQKIRFYTKNSQITRSEFMPNYLLTNRNATFEARVIDSTKVKIDPTTGLEIQPYLSKFTSLRQLQIHEDDNTPWMGPKYLFEHVKQPILASAPISVIPKPKSLEILSDEWVDLSKGIQVNLFNFSKASLAQALKRLSLFGVKEVEGGININISRVNQSELGLQAYELEVKQDEVNIKASSGAGAFYGLQSLLGLLDGVTLKIPTVKIIAEPHYLFRGLHIDSARNFRSKQFILDTIAHMASYKLNRLHLHLADDEGWRLDIDGLPELTQVGGYRCFDLKELNCLLPQLGAGHDKSAPVNGFYSREDYIEILRYAQAHHIEVIPSLDMPGHSRAAIISMEARYQRLLAQGVREEAQRYRLKDPLDNTQYSSIQHYSDNTLNVCIPETYAFIDKVLGEVQKMHDQAGVRLKTYHIGADETAGAWVDSPACKSLLKGKASLNGYFIEKISAIIAKKGIQVAGWSDGLDDVEVQNMPPNVQSNVWKTLSAGGHKVAHKHINSNWDVIISNPDATYFDFPYESHPMERGNHWAARAVNTRKVFEFMPDNLPAHAEIWNNSYHKTYKADDTRSYIKGKNRADGLQGHLWSEMLRTDKQAEYMLYPRLLALAERAWHRPQWALPYKQKQYYDKSTGNITSSFLAKREQDWQRFVAILGYKELIKLQKLGVFYRIPSVAVGQSPEGELMLFTEIPGFVIEVKTNKGWQQATHQTTLSEVKLVRAVLNGRIGRAMSVH